MFAPGYRLNTSQTFGSLGGESPSPHKRGSRSTYPPVSPADFVGGTGVTVATILDQSNSTIVQTDVDLPHDRWDRIEIDAVDPGWRKSGRLEGGLQFIWDGPDAPSILVLEQSSPTWVPVEGDLVVFRGGDR